MDMTADSDGDLLAQFRHARSEQRRQAFCALYERHGGSVRAWLGKLTGSAHLADDLTQETFLRALRALDRFEGRSTVRTWLLTIATNLWRDHLRRKRPVTGTPTAEACSPDAAPPEFLLRRESVQIVRQAVDRLPESLREPLMLVRLEGLKYREAAVVLGLSVGAIRMRVHRAHLALAAELAPYQDTDGEQQR
jgi:RNA polymerase sigma-70 factor, ECF subfamily